MLVAMMLVLASPNPQSLDAPRKAYAACIKRFETSSLARKLATAAYSTALKSACQGEAETLVGALVAYDVAMGSPRSSAASNAASDIADYVATSEERYRDLASPQ